MSLRLFALGRELRNDSSIPRGWKRDQRHCGLWLGGCPLHGYLGDARIAYGDEPRRRSRCALGPIVAIVRPSVAAIAFAAVIAPRFQRGPLHDRWCNLIERPAVELYAEVTRGRGQAQVRDAAFGHRRQYVRRT